MRLSLLNRVVDRSQEQEIAMSIRTHPMTREGYEK